ncbi:MAG: hypothetical protein SCH71_02605 [Desulfobulbaceae bacterium]|nr:hypothetical protein [Desulfobulbaceae bacterium]
MAFTIQRVEYYYTTVRDIPGEAYRLLNMMAGVGINQLAFSAIPIGPNTTQLAVFPADPEKFSQEAKMAGMSLDGPHHALLIQGDDELGALAGIHQKLYEANINVYSSSGVTDGQGSFGYLIYVREEDFDRAARTLGV